MSSLFKSAFLIGFFSLMSRILGLYRDRLLSTTFGAFDGKGIYDLDAYFAAFRIPDFVFNLLILGTVSSAFIPIFSGYIHKKSLEEGWKYVNSLLNVLIFILFILLCIALIFTPHILSIITPGFHGEKFDLTVQLTRLMLLSPLIFTISSVFQSIQNAFHRFFYYSLAPLLYNAGIILGIILFSDSYGVFGAAYGVIAGALMHLAIQIFPVLSLGYRYRFQVDYRRKDIIDSFKLMAPRIIGQSAAQISLVFDTLIASLLSSGSITILNFALNLSSLPIGIVGISLSTASFSMFSDLASRKDIKSFGKELINSLNSLFYLLIPASIGMFLLRKDIAFLILSGGKFQEDAVLLTSSVVGIYAVGILAQSMIALLARAFYALKNTRIPTCIGLSSIVLNIVLSLTFVLLLDLGIHGLALANVSASIFNALMLMSLMKYRLNIQIADIPYLKQILLATTLMTLGIIGLQSYFLHSLTHAYLLIKISLYVLAGGSIYFFILKLFKSK